VKEELKDESFKLADAKAPKSVDENKKRIINLQIKLSFVDTFKVLALISASLAFIGVLFAYFGVVNKIGSGKS